MELLKFMGNHPFLTVFLAFVISNTIIFSVKYIFCSKCKYKEECDEEEKPEIKINV